MLARTIAMVTTIARYIEMTPDVRGGKPRIAGRRITIADIAILYLRMERSLEAIAQEYELSLASVHAAMAYYYDHQVEIEQSMTDSEAFAEAFCQSHPSPLQAKLVKNNNDD